VQDGAIEIDLIPPKVHEFEGPQPMPEAGQDHRAIPVSVAVPGGGSDEFVNLPFGQVFARAQFAVLGPPRPQLFVFDPWGDQPETWFRHGN
jgi:hypothetical protein